MGINLDKALKQRLLGAIILAALLVIFVPEWLDGAGHRSRYPQTIQIRDKPVFQAMPSPSSPVSKSTTKDDNAIVNNRKRSTIQAWVLQVASFKDMKNAESLKNQLMKDFPTNIDVLKTPKETIYRVIIGPELDRSSLENIKEKILKSNKLEGVIKSHP